ncbi:MAG: hypothetical protein GY822_06340 [Deltaproteobacteria bacterium]|nr:hypothetical protein [Deltaproteobacteria bacterium]
MTDEKQEAQTLVLDVLQGKKSEATHPQLFDDDVFYLNVRYLERENLPWLLERV